MSDDIDLKRIAVLKDLHVLDTLPQKEYDDVTLLCTLICNVPIAFISFIDEKRQWFKSKIGLEITETSRQDSICAYTIIQEEPLIIQDILCDDRFKTMRIPRELEIRFYASFQIKIENENIGTLCIVDTEPRELNESQKQCMVILANHTKIFMTFEKYQQQSHAKIQEIEQFHRQLYYKEPLEDMKHVILTNISHEIKTPLNGILACIEMLSEIEQENVQTTVHVLRSCVDDVLTVFTNFMDLARDEASLTLYNEIASLHKLMDDVLHNFRLKAREKLLDFKFINDIPDSCIVEIDITRLRAVISNLLSNAIKFTSNTGYVHVEVHCTDENYEFENNCHDDPYNHRDKYVTFDFKVTDSGEGMPPEFVDNLFQTFSQRDMSSIKKHKGIGNGLAVTKKIVDAFNGNIRYSSEVGKGSTFRISIPCKIYENLERKKEIILKKTLIVDDNPLNIEIASTLMRKLVKGIVLVTAINGDKAIEVLNNEDNIDVVLMDCRMPVKDGYDATLDIRKTNKDIVILALTASSDNKDLQRCFNVGMDDIMMKPINMKQMKHVLSKWFHFE